MDTKGPDPGTRMIMELRLHSEPLTLKQLARILHISSRVLQQWMNLIKKEEGVIEDEQGRFTIKK